MSLLESRAIVDQGVRPPTLRERIRDLSGRKIDSWMIREIRELTELAHEKQDVAAQDTLRWLTAETKRLSRSRGI